MINNSVTLGDGSTVHAIEQAQSFGPSATLEGLLLVEDKDGNIRRMNGKQLAEFHEREPDFVKHWKLQSRD